MRDRALLAGRRLKALLRQFPAVAILGARQVGRSTLARIALPGFAVFDLEDPGDFRRLAADPLFALGQQRRVVIDEAQRLPALFPVLRSFLDRDSRREVVLLGSGGGVTPPHGGSKGRERPLRLRQRARESFTLREHRGR